MAQPSQVQHYNEPVEKQLGFAAIVQTGNTLRLSGIVSVDSALNVVSPGDMAAQVNRIYDIMQETLAMSGATLRARRQRAHLRHGHACLRGRGRGARTAVREMRAAGRNRRAGRGLCFCRRR